MTATYDPIATTTLGSAASTITFSSIGSGFTDLRLVFVPSSGSTFAGTFLRFNNDTATNYSRTNLFGDGTNVTSNRATNATNIGLGNATDDVNPSLFLVDVFSYAGSTNKTVLANINNDRNGSGFVFTLVGLYRSTSAITRIDLINNGGTYNTGTTATLYGIKAE